ncbi:MAG: hypothetical protein CVU88_01425 [Firmicutes bacterium HGW-Firmicutes-13]|nr:MAG: hypothetical protein CVU88_01425 [Firmicutes bacterium HGW-Firmicutes-13]
MLSLKIFLKTLKNNFFWIKISALIFFAGFLIGLAASVQKIDYVQEFSAPYFGFLEELAEEIIGSSPAKGIFLLFFNNIFASLRILFLGIILGIPPLFGLLINGGLLGVVTVAVTQQNISPVLFLALGILPHGILEIPAFLISAAFGLKLGYHVVYPINGKNRWESTSFIINEVLQIIYFIAFLLIAAAAVEILVTPRLIRFLFI